MVADIMSTESTFTDEERRILEIEHVVYQARKLIDEGHVEGRVADMLEAMIVALRCKDLTKIYELAAEAAERFPSTIERFKTAVEAERLAEN